MLDYLKRVIRERIDEGETLNDEVDKSISALVNALVAEGIRSGQSITIDIQASGEHPYRVYVPDEDLPVVGVAYTPALPED